MNGMPETASLLLRVHGLGHAFGAREVLRGLIDPPQCPLFNQACRPDSPAGPCMVSAEGSCSAWALYG